MIEIFGPLVSPFVIKLIAAADYKGLDYWHQEYVGVRELRTLNPITGNVPVARIDGEVLIDTSFIVQRFDEIQPTPALFSYDPLIATKQPMSQGLGRLPNEMLISELTQRFDDLVVLLGDSPFFYSEQPSVADFALYGVFNTGIEGGITPEFGELVSQRPSLSEWRLRVRKATEH